MREYEKKIMLTADEYAVIVILMCKYAPISIQTNYYFDTDDFSMNRKGITYRIRAKDGRYTATVKNHNTECSDCSTEENLAEKSEFDPEIFNALGLRHQGELITERIVVYKNSYCEIVVDRNTYLEYIDFELEVEYRKEDEGKVQTILETIATVFAAKKLISNTDEFLNRVGKGKSKSERFFERKQKNN